MNIALITARGGSKGLPGKNIYALAGKPLLAWSIDAAKESGLFEDVYVSTDCNDIASVALKFGAKVIERPEELATDNASSHVVIEHAINELNLDGSDSVMLLQPTSPLRTAADIKQSFEVFEQNEKCTCVISVYEPDNTPAKAYKILESGEITGLVSAEAPYTRRQDLPRCFQPNGAIYLFSVEGFSQSQCIPKFGVFPYVMEEERSLDVDTLADMQKIEAYLQQK
ncbi:acylneuraminate cytidylyltransferase family protein [Enterovibrio norvegicus]|uniref:acylneuraminate cytidylyltransferase family protein n=1 Tax=Enterovibrio norvegicus TaxID=188144 RepID=UPI00354D63D4